MRRARARAAQPNDAVRRWVGDPPGERGAFALAEALRGRLPCAGGRPRSLPALLRTGRAHPRFVRVAPRSARGTLAPLETAPWADGAPYGHCVRAPAIERARRAEEVRCSDGGVRRLSRWRLRLARAGDVRSRRNVPRARRYRPARRRRWRHARNGGPDGPSTPTGGTATPRGPTTPPGPSGGASGDPGASPQGGFDAGADLTRWQFWWELNKDRFLGPRAKLYAGDGLTESETWWLGRGEKPQAVDIALGIERGLSTPASCCGRSSPAPARPKRAATLRSRSA